jgi:hypothetical protein
MVQKGRGGGRSKGKSIEEEMERRGLTGVGVLQTISFFI